MIGSKAAHKLGKESTVDGLCDRWGSRPTVAFTSIQKVRECRRLVV